MLKRFFDIFFALIGLIILFPVLLLISLIIVIDNGFPVFYLQSRVGLHNKDFKIIKFRTMKKDSDKLGLLTVGGRDPRITSFGYYLRKFKLDELPQLMNVLIGDMSFVGPRPEVRKYVELYNAEQREILNVRPGITDHASIEYFNENELLARSKEPERTYVEEIMPAKIELNKKYLNDGSLINDLKIIFATISKILN